MKYLSILIAYIFLINQAHSQSVASSPASIFSLVAETAERMCGEVPNSGWNVNGSVNAAVDLSLGAFFKKLSDAKATGAAGINGGKYAGPLREQLIPIRKDTQDCMKTVSDRLLQYVQQTQKDQNVPSKKRIDTSATKLIPAPVVYPKISSEEFALKWLQLLDKQDLHAAHQGFDPSIKAMSSEKSFIRNVQEPVATCYPVRSRNSGAAQSRMLPAATNAFKRDEYVHVFQTEFKNSEKVSGESLEMIGIVLSENGEWKIIEFVSSCIANFYNKKR